MSHFSLFSFDFSLPLWHHSIFSIKLSFPINNLGVFRLKKVEDIMLSMEKMRTPTSHDVAKLAGVSQSAVSRVFSGGKGVSEASKLKVLEAAKKLHYRPNAFARGLTQQRSGFIGIIFPETLSPVYHDTLLRLSNELMREGYSSLLIPYHLRDSDNYSVAKLFHYRVEGVIVMSSTLDSQLVKECFNLNIPLVQVGRTEHGTHSDTVVSDNEEGGKLAAESLFYSGAKRIAYLSGDKNTSTNQEREMGFCQRIKELTGRFPDVYEAKFSYQAGVEATRRLLAEPTRPDALFCANDMIALGAIDAAKHYYNLTLPEELQIIGFDDIPQAEWLNYQLSTVKQDVNAIVQSAVSLLKKRIDDDEYRTSTINVPVKLVQRNTSKSIT